MATEEPSSQSGDQSPQPISLLYSLKAVIVHDEIPGQSVLWEVSSLPPVACVQKRKRDWSPVSEEEEEMQEDWLDVRDGVAGVPPYFMLQRPAQKKQRGSSCSELEAEAKQEK
ncbi:hypothetical protein GW7_21109 [Heterocephalus glaber]|uniref:Uncharacterized protein n=1 Tax=Heterocephalus glaber TaxID=10181 RepID=G5BJ30_HETGA|nr:hypothetical protein GW7_21109 [Heterocephalus glaber]